MTELKYIMTHKLNSVSPNDSVRVATDIMKHTNSGVILVFDKEKLKGIFSERDLIRRVIIKGLNIDQTKIKDVMTKKVITGFEEDNIYDTLKKMSSHNIRHLPILNNSNVCVGILSIKDVIESVKNLLDEQNNALLEYIICFERVKSVINEVGF
jgi:CBS domain-containing protein